MVQPGPGYVMTDQALVKQIQQYRHHQPGDVSRHQQVVVSAVERNAIAQQLVQQSLHNSQASLQRMSARQSPYLPPQPARQASNTRSLSRPGGHLQQSGPGHSWHPGIGRDMDYDIPLHSAAQWYCSA